MENKKGISPLIATVLILGFTVALAAIIMVWGQRFTQGIQETTEDTANTQLVCTTDVAFKITNVCRAAAESGSPGNGYYRVFVENNGNKKIDKLDVRFYKSASLVQTVALFTVAGIDKYGIDYKDSGWLTGINQLRYVEAIPTITVNGKQVTCTANRQSFGSLEGADVSMCS